MNKTEFQPYMFMTQSMWDDKFRTLVNYNMEIDEDTYVNDRKRTRTTDDNIITIKKKKVLDRASKKIYTHNITINDIDLDDKMSVE